jgi:hypothetical protein
MKTVIILFTISLFCCTSIKANTLSDSYVKNRIYQIASFSNADSSNYKVKVVKSDMEYTQIRFTIVDNHNNPLAAMVWLNDINGKAISSVYGNDDGKISIMIYDNTILNMTVGIIGYGKVFIPVKNIKDKVTDIKVQLYEYTSTN